MSQPTNPHNIYNMNHIITVESTSGNECVSETTYQQRQYTFFPSVYRPPIVLGIGCFPVWRSVL